MADLQTLPGTGIAFSGFPIPKHIGLSGQVAELSGGILRVITSEGPMPITLPADQSHFGFLAKGDLYVDVDTLRIPQGYYFSIPGAARLYAQKETLGVIVSRPGYRSFMTMGRIEDQGRLRYIDGCTDSLLIPPIKLGDPCLNLLYFPPKTDQTMHTHPSDRIGMILSGVGVCVTEDERGRVETPLTAGMLFCIHAGGRHRFQTLSESMRVLAYHPDSDFGPTDHDHPMINRTMVDGVSAAKLTELHTMNGNGEGV